MFLYDIEIDKKILTVVCIVKMLKKDGTLTVLLPQ